MDERAATTSERLPDQEAPPRRRHPAFKAVLRIAVGGAVIGLLLLKGDLGEIAAVIGDARPLYLVAAFGIILLGLLVSAARWQAYLKPLGLSLPTPTLFRLYFVGTFFNAFLPTGVGGDAYKAMRLRRETGMLARAFASVFLDRFAGVIGLALVGFAGVVARVASGDRGRVVGVAAALAGAVLIAATLVLWFGERLAGRKRRPAGRFAIRARLRRMLAATATAGRDPEASVRGIALGVVFQTLVLAYHVVIARALRLDVSIAVLACIVVISSLATTIPLTINGLGFREGSYVWALGAYGVGHDAALAFGLLILGVLLASSVVGGIVYVLGGGEVP